MSISRRNLLTSATAVAIVSQIPAQAWRFGPTIGASPASGWSQVPFGDGGYVLGIDIAAGGLAAGATSKTDVSGGYWWDNTKSLWKQVITWQNFSSAPIDGGVWELRVAPSNGQRLYMIYGDPAYNVGGYYALWVSSDAGTSWTKTALTFTCHNNPFLYLLGYVISNGGGQRLTNQKLVIDPVTADVCYVGLPFGCVATGTYAGLGDGCFVTFDGGSTFSAVSGVPASTKFPGFAGMCVDPTSSTTTVNGKSVKSIIYLPSGGQGVYQSTNGGVSFSKISSDATPSLTFTATTAAADDIIVIQVYCWDQGTPKNYNQSTTNGGPVSNTGTGALNWQYRAGPTNNNYGYGYMFEYWAHAASAGTYNISVAMNDGAYAYELSATTKASWTGTAAFNSGGGASTATAVSGLTGTILAGDAVGTANVGNVKIQPYGSGGTTGTGGLGSYLLDGFIEADLGSQSFTTKRPRANWMNVFVVSGAYPYNTGTDSGTPFAAGGAQFSGSGQYQIAPAITLANPGLTFIVAWDPHSTTTDTGYTAMGGSSDYKFYTEISASPQAAGTYNPQFGNSSGANGIQITDAIIQASGKTIALESSGYADAAPAGWAQPVNPTTAQIDSTGVFWCVDGPSAYNNNTPGSIWRHYSGAWERIDGSQQSAPWGMLRGGFTSIGNAIACDPRSGQYGVWFTGPTNGFTGFNTYNGNATLTAINWYGGTFTNGNATITSIMPWLNFGTGHTTGAPVGDMVVDPVTGKLWQAGGNGTFLLDSTLDYHPYVPNYVCTGVNNSQGIEEMIVDDVCTPVGGPITLFGVQDEMVMTSNLTDYTGSTKLFYKPGDSNVWNLDFAGINPQYVCTVITGLNGEFCGWSNNYGQDGSWSLFTTQPGANNYGGFIAASTYSNSATANVVCIAGLNSGAYVVPQYTTDNGQTWNTPSGFFGTSRPFQQYALSGVKLIASDRVTPNVFYIYYPGVNSSDVNAGLWRSTDGGASYTQMSSFVADNECLFGGYVLLPVVGHAGHIMLLPTIYQQSSHQIRVSTDGGATWNNIPLPSGMTNVLNFSLGKAATGNSYATILAYCTDGTNSYFYRGAANSGGSGAPNSGWTWTQYGKIPDLAPSTAYAGFVNGMYGDWNVFGRCYVAWGAGGAIKFDP